MKKFLTWFLGISIALIFLVGAIWIGVGYYLSPQSELKKSDAIVVVSGGQTLDRAEKGINLYRQGWAPKIIFSGAALDDGPSNAIAMRAEALEKGIPSEDIYVDEESQNTYENAVNSKKILDDFEAKKIILVTGPYHQRRANQTFEKVLGDEYEVIGVSAVDYRWSKSGWWKRGFPLFISLSEFWKLIYISLTGNYQ